MNSIDILLLAASILLVTSVVASNASRRLGIPALLLFMGIGMLAGSEGPGGIFFDNYFLAQSLGIVALTLILFDGGLRTEWTQVRRVLWRGAALSTAGVVISTALVGWVAHQILKLSWYEGFLLGAIVSSTDAAAVFSILRSRNVSLKGDIRPLVEFESGSNDPMAVFLTLGFIRLLSEPGHALWELVPAFVQQMTLGAVFGYAGGRLLVLAINRLQLDYEGLYPVMTVGGAILIYSAANALGGNGFLAVYIAGLVMGNSVFLHKRSLTRFHDGLGWMMQIAMFLTLGLLVFPSALVPIALRGALLALFLMLVARPVSVFIALGFSTRLTLRQKAMVSWLGLRGAAPIILATFPLLSGLPHADAIFNLVFFIVIMSVILQGPSIPWVAKRLSVGAPAKEKARMPIEFEPETFTDKRLSEVIVPRDSKASGKAIVKLGMPESSLIVLITRGNEFVVPRGQTILKEEDTLLVLANPGDLTKVRSLVGSSVL